jgi:tripartite-type tricarboxylate transporter receptor subunit TctC
MKSIAAFTRTLPLALLAALFAFHAAPARGQYPSRLVRFIVPIDPGTGPDLLSRTIGQRLSEKWGVSVVTENRPGAGASIGTEHVAKSTGDGHTILVTASTLVMYRSLRPSAPYDPIKDFAPVVPLAIGQLALATHPSLGVSSIGELVTAAKANPGSINYGSPGNGSPQHFAMELFKQAMGIDLTHIPYRSTGGALQDFLSGQTKVMFVSVSVAMPHIAPKRLNMLSSGGVRRAAATPDIPSLAEASGIRDIDTDIWFGMFAPSATPAPIVAKLNADVNGVLQMQDIKEIFSRQGLVVTGGKSDDLASVTRGDLEKWTRVVREAKIRAD